MKYHEFCYKGEKLLILIKFAPIQSGREISAILLTVVGDG